MPQNRTDDRSASPNAQYWMAVTRQVQTLAIKAQQARRGNSGSSTQTRKR